MVISATIIHLEQRVPVGLLALLLCGWLALVAPALQGQSLDPLANVNRTTVVEGGELTLRVRTRQTESQLDLAPLLRDFEVVAQDHSTNNPALSGLGTDFLEWEIILSPRRTGTLTIPPLTVGERQTHPITVRVLPLSPEQQAVRDQTVELEVTIGDTELYVGESTVVTLTLYYNVNVNGSFADLAPGDAEWIPLGGQKTGSTRDTDGKTLNFTRFKYLYTPLSAGPRELPAFSFEGDYRLHSLSPRQTLRNVSSNAVPLVVKPIPEAFPEGATWLPAYDLSLNEYWSPARTQLVVGDQVQRQLELHTEGPPAYSLPVVLTQSDIPDQVRRYPGNAETAEALDNERRHSTRTETVSYLFTATGDLTLPAVRLPWWDLDSDSLRWAELPAQSFTVSAPVAPVDLSALSGNDAISDENTDPNTFRYIALGALVVVLMLGTLGFLLHKWRRSSRQAPARRRFENGAAPSHPQDQEQTQPRLNALLRHAGQRLLPRRFQSVRENPPTWILEAKVAAQDHRWRDLLQTFELAHPRLWPDFQAIERYWGVRGMSELIKRTQVVLYGNPSLHPDTEQLAEDWQALLVQWPDAPRQPSQDKNQGPKDLYPD